MLEKFTEEEIEQIKRELKKRDSKARKEKLIEQQMYRLEKLFPRDKYQVTGSVSYRHTVTELKECLLTICDHITHNYALKKKGTARHDGEHYVRAGLIPAETEDRYREAFTMLVDVIEEWYLPWPEGDRIAEENRKAVEKKRAEMADAWKQDHEPLVRLKPGVKPHST
ncbi:MAG: hypothetical protein IJ240_10200 [Clostridia bacterium]|nr:hypothetical protein [Clostridia bacterium]